MNIAEIVNRRRTARGQSGFSNVTGLMAIAGSTTMAAMMLMSSDEQIAAADATVCQYNKGVLMNAVEIYHAANLDEGYPAPAGEDGFDALREAGFLRTESKYWRYIGVDAKNVPQYELRLEVPDCE